jgi:hypothetical protein
MGHHHGPGRDDQGLAGALQGPRHRLDHPPVRLDIGLELREVVDEGRVDHAVARLGAGDDAGYVGQLTAMDLDAEARQGVGAGVAPRQSEHLMARRQELGQDRRADETRGACQENTHAGVLATLR